MPMNADQLTTIIDSVYDDIEQRPNGNRFHVSDKVLSEAVNNSSMFSQLLERLASTEEVTYRVDSDLWLAGLLFGIEIGKAIHEVEELEGLGR